MRLTERWLRTLVTSLVAITLVGCAKPAQQPTSGGTPKDPLKLSIITTALYVPPFDAAFKEIVQDWAKKNNAEVNIEFLSINDLDAKVAKAIETKSADIVLLPRQGVTLYPGSLLDVSDVAGDLDKKYGGFYQQGRAVAMDGDRWFSIPFYSFQNLLFYRKDMVEKVGEKAPETWEDIKRIGEKLKKAYPDVVPYGQALGRSNDANLFLYSLIWSFGGSVVGKDGKTVTLNSSESAQALKFLMEMVDKGLLPTGTLGWDDTANNTAWVQGKIAMTQNTPSITWKAKRETPDIYKNTGSATWPKGPEGRFPGAMMYGLAALKSTKNPDAAKDLLRTIFDKPNYEKLVTIGEGQAVPTLKAYAGMKLWEDPDLKHLITVAEEATELGYPGPQTRVSSEIYARGVLLEMAAKVVNKQKSVDDALKEAADQVSKIVAESK